MAARENRKQKNPLWLSWSYTVLNIRVIIPTKLPRISGCAFCSGPQRVHEARWCLLGWSYFHLITQRAITNRSPSVVAGEAHWLMTALIVCQSAPDKLSRPQLCLPGCPMALRSGLEHSQSFSLEADNSGMLAGGKSKSQQFAASGLAT